MRQNTEDRWLRVRDVAEVTGLHRATIYRLIKGGELPHSRVGKVILVRQAVLNSWLEAREG